MFQNYLISKLLDMEHMILTEVDTLSNQLVLHLEMERRACECPACRTLTSSVHDYRIQRIKDCPIQGKTVVWMYKKRRYRCPCCGKRFYESNYLIPKWHRITNRLALLSMNMLEEKMSRKDIARACGVSEATVGRWLQFVEFGQCSKLPSVISIDEFKGNTEYGKFQGIVIDPVESAAPVV